MNENKQAEPVAFAVTNEEDESVELHLTEYGYSTLKGDEFLYTHSAPAVAQGAILRRVALGLLKGSKANFTKQFGVCANADWVYRDLEELFSCWGSEAPAVAVQISDEMAYSFSRAIGDSSLSANEVEQIKTGLRAALANVPTVAVNEQLLTALKGLYAAIDSCVDLTPDLMESANAAIAQADAAKGTTK